MTSETLLDIAKKFDNVQFVDRPTFMHFWLDLENDSIQSKPSSVEHSDFHFTNFLDFLELEKSKGNTVYIMENSHSVLYDSRTFEPILKIRIKSEFGCIKKASIKYKNKELAETSDFDKYQYLLIK